MEDIYSECVFMTSQVIPNDGVVFCHLSARTQTHAHTHTLRNAAQQYHLPSSNHFVEILLINFVSIRHFETFKLSSLLIDARLSAIVNKLTCE